MTDGEEMEMEMCAWCGEDIQPGREVSRVINDSEEVFCSEQCAADFEEETKAEAEAEAEAEAGEEEA